MKKLLALFVLVLLVCASLAASAQSKKAERKPARTERAKKERKPVVPARAVTDAGVSSEPDLASTGDAGEVRVLDGGARVFRFGEVEIEGRLKSPQLVYFLRRVRAEFAAGDLGHRSFYPELSETRKESEF